MKKFIYIVVVAISVFLLITFAFPVFAQSKVNESQDSKNYSTEGSELSTETTISKGTKSDTSDDIAQNDIFNIPNILLVNKTNKLNKSYVPEDLRIPNVRFISYADPTVKKMERTAADSLEKLFEAALKDGINLLAVSGYRDYRYQEGLYNNKVKATGKIEADKYVAQPGASEHQTGLAMDVLSDEYSSLDGGFENTKAYIWLKENSFKYGFIIRYTKEKESVTMYNFEPWHLRYVGIKAATEIVDGNLALEEYVNNK